MKILASFTLLLTVLLSSAFNMRGLSNDTLQKLQQQQQLKETGSFLRITNGLTAAAGEFRYQVGMIKDQGGGFMGAGGSLISLEWVLTGTHTTIDATAFYIYLGQIKREHPYVVIHKPTHYIIEHPDYKRDTMRHDIALIKIPRVNLLLHNVEVIPLRPLHGTYESYVGLHAFLAGWGYTSDRDTIGSTTLQYARLPIIENHECAKTYGNVSIYEGKLCTAAPNGISGCKGDSGGPLVLAPGHFQIGILSFGSINCETGYPNAFTRIDSYLEWIHLNMRSIHG